MDGQQSGNACRHEIDEQRGCLRVVGGVGTAREAFHPVVDQVVQERSHGELIGPGDLRTRGARACCVQGVDEGMGQGVEVVDQHALGIGGAVGEFACHQLRVVLALAAGPHGQHGVDKGLDDAPQVAANVSNTKELGRLIYTDYVYPFELASVVLLVAIVAAIAITYRGAKPSKSSKVADQIRVKAKDRVRVLQMPAEKQD